MTKLLDIRRALEATVAQADLPEQLVREIRSLLTGLERHDDMSVVSFLQMISRAGAEPKVGGQTAADLAKSLKDVFGADDAFRAELKRIQSDRHVTRETLNQVYATLTGRSRKLAAKATKAKLAQDIADFRLERVRSERAAEMFKGKPVYAE